MYVFSETKTHEEKEIYKDILGKEILSRKWKKKKEDFRNVVMATTIAVVYVIPYYSQVYRHKGVQGAQFSKLWKQCCCYIQQCSFVISDKLIIIVLSHSQLWVTAVLQIKCWSLYFNVLFRLSLPVTS